MATIDEYFQNATNEQKAVYDQVALLVQQIVGETDKIISYGIPTFKYKGRPLLYFGIFKDHYSLFPASDELIEAVPQLASFRAGKGTLKFTSSNPIPPDLIEQIIRYQKQAIDKH